MIIIEHKNKEYQLKTKLSELTLGEFEIISNIFSTPESNVDKWIDIIHYLTEIPKEDIEKWDSVKFETMIKSMFKSDVTLDNLTEVTIGNKTYKVSDNVTARDLSVIEKIFASNEKHAISMIIASAFKDEEIGMLNYDIKTIRERSQLFRDLPCEGLINYLYSHVNSFMNYLNINSPVKIFDEA